MKFNYYSLETDLSDRFGRGEELDYDEAVEGFRRVNTKEFAANKGLFSLKEIETVDPMLERNPEEWQKAFATAIFMISGCLPQATDRKYNKKVYSALKQASKKDAVLEKLLQSQQFVFACLPYLIAGFQAESKGWSKDGNNNFGNFIQTIKALDQNATVSTFLCAHREKAPKIVDDLDLGAARKAANLILGIIKNFPNTATDSKPLLRILQPDASVEGIGSVFPEIFLTYLNNGKLGELIMALQRHYSDLGDFLREEYGTEVVLSDLKPHKRAIDEYSADYFGEHWKDLETLPRDRAKPGLEVVSLDDLADVIENTADKVKRFMPYYEQGLYIPRDLLERNKATAKQYSDRLPMIDELIEHATDDFANIRTVTSKAIYETVFCCVWGQNARKDNEIVIGLEREQNIFQSMGIAFGYNEGKLDYHTNHQVPAMFAKRSVGGNPRSITDLSFRQFWRLSEKTK